MFRFLRLNIATKILLGYLPIVFLTILTVAFALSDLNQLHEINESVIERDLPLIDKTDKMLDTLLAQEAYGRRYIILSSPDMLELFLNRGEEFKRLVEQSESLPNLDGIPVSRINTLHNEFNQLFLKRFEYITKPDKLSQQDHKELIERYEYDIESKQKELITLIEKVSSNAHRSQNEKSLIISSILSSSFRTLAILCVLGVVLSVGAALIITLDIGSSINKLKLATGRIAKGNFNNMPDVKSSDELGELSNAFNYMAKRLKELEEMDLDANPLTRLPGSVAIENTLKERIASSKALAFCLIDMDNFKAFNDRYGYARGNQVILATADIIKEKVSIYGTDEDFIGHIGGDDFVVITYPDRHTGICEAIIKSFDIKIPDFYDPKDRERGYIEGETRQGDEIIFPLMTISIAVVTNQKRELKSHIQIGEIAAELKEFAKTKPQSTYTVDRREDG